MSFIIDNFSDVWKLVLRLFLAVFCGFVIGYERKSRSKEAGVRTHSIVCLASALIMIISKYAFLDITAHSDAARIAAQVVTGIGFLGAGMIFYRRDVLQGLTTAAGVWATAGIGMAIGAGMIVIGIVTAVLVLLIQLSMHLHMSSAASRKLPIAMKAVVRVDDVSNIDDFKKIFNVNKFIRYRTYTSNDLPFVELEFMTREDYSLEKIYEITKNNPFIISIESNEE